MLLRYVLCRRETRAVFLIGLPTRPLVIRSSILHFIHSHLLQTVDFIMGLSGFKPFFTLLKQNLPALPCPTNLWMLSPFPANPFSFPGSLRFNLPSIYTSDLSSTPGTKQGTYFLQEYLFLRKTVNYLFMYASTIKGIKSRLLRERKKGLDRRSHFMKQKDSLHPSFFLLQYRFAILFQRAI